MDPKTLILFVFSIFCLALFAAFYVTGVHMNYFGGSRDDAAEGVVTELTEDKTVKIVPLKDE